MVLVDESTLRYAKESIVSTNPKNEVNVIRIAEMKYGLRSFSPRSRTFEYSDKKCARITTVIETKVGEEENMSLIRSVFVTSDIFLVSDRVYCCAT